MVVSLWKASSFCSVVKLLYMHDIVYINVVDLCSAAFTLYYEKHTCATYVRLSLCSKCVFLT